MPNKCFENNKCSIGKIGIDQKTIQDVREYWVSFTVFPKLNYGLTRDSNLLSLGLTMAGLNWNCDVTNFYPTADVS